MNNRIRPEMVTASFDEGAWTVIYSALRAKAIYIGRNDDLLGHDFKTRVYAPGQGLIWSADYNDLALPKYIRERTLRAVRARRRTLRLPV